MAGLAFIHNLADAAEWAANLAQAKPRFQFVYNDVESNPSSKYRLRWYKASSGGAAEHDSGDVAMVVSAGSTITHDATAAVPNSLGTKAVANIIQNGSSGDANNYTTASVTMKAGRLYLLAVENSKGSATADAISSITGGAGLPTFISRSSVTYNSNLNRVSIWFAVPLVDYSGTLTINFGGVTQTGAIWVLDEIIGVDPVTNHGVVQQATGTGNSGTALATLAAFASGDNWTYGAMAHAAATATAPGGSFVELADQTQATPAQALQTEYRSVSDTSVDATFTSAQWGACAVEIQSAERWWTVEVWDSLGESSGESSRTAFKVRYGQVLYEHDSGSPSSSAWGFSTAAVPAGTGMAAIYRSATGAGGAGANAWKSSLGQVAIQRWFNVLIRLQTYTGGTDASLADMTFSYQSSATSPDNWTVNQPGEWALDEDLRRFTIRSFRESIASGTTGDRYLYPFRQTSGDDIPVVQSTKYTWSAYVKTDVPLTGGSLKLRICRAGSNTDILAESLVGVTDTSSFAEGWQRLTLTFTTEALMTYLRPMVVYVRTTGVSTDKFWVDATQLEPGGVATPYHPSIAGRSVRMDVGGVMIDAFFGGTLRMRGSDGGVFSVVELGTRGLRFGGIGGAELYHKSSTAVFDSLHVPSVGERRQNMTSWR